MKFKLESRSGSSNADNQRLKDAKQTAVSGLQTILAIAKEVAGVTGVPGLKEGIGSVLFVIDVVKTTSANVENIEKLARNIESLTAILQRAKGQGSPSSEIINRLNTLSASLNESSNKVKKIASRSAMTRALRFKDDAAAISDCVQAISWSIQSFMVETMLAIEFSFGEHANTMDERMKDLRDMTERRFQQAAAKWDLKDGDPPHAIYALFDSKIDRVRCAAFTRLNILSNIARWIDIEDFNPYHPTAAVPGGDGEIPQRTAHDSCVFWINGCAGTGKTTIAYTIAEDCRARKILGASFFCSRDDAECSNPSLIFTTIAYQLGLFNSAFQEEVRRTLKANPTIAYSSVPYQLEQLIVNPLHAVAGTFPPCVVVLDALDECKDSGTTSVILSSLSRFVSQLSPIRFLVTSRPETNVTTTFGFRELQSATQKLVLHEVGLDAVEKDIEHYLLEKLELTRAFYRLNDTWPTIKDLSVLAQRSHGLFIFAATSIKFIEDRSYRDPAGQLRRLLSDTSTSTAADVSSPFHVLDQLYNHVLGQAFPDIIPHISRQLKTILGSIVLLQDPLPSPALEQLLCLESGMVERTLLGLHSVIKVPDDPTNAIRLLHPSFSDFITGRCRNPNYAINAEVQHTLLARLCLESMKALKRDLCEIKDPTIFNSEVGDLPDRIAKHIPPHLQYACRHWAWHFSHSMVSNELLKLLEDMSTKYLLYWLEACSLLGELRGTLVALDMVQRVLLNLRVCNGVDGLHILSLLRDCECFTREFFSIIGVSALQVYHSALHFTPMNTLIRKVYSKEILVPITLYNAVDDERSACMCVMEGHDESVASLAFSPDAMLLVSGSSDSTIRFWDAASGAHLNTLQGHTDIVNCVTFSPDGTFIASASYDKTLRLWDAVSGAHLSTLRGHEASVFCIAFSLDGMCIMSGSGDHTLRLWDAANGAHLNTLYGHTGSVFCVAFSPDSKHVASGSVDDTLRLWDAASGTLLKTLRGHTGAVSCVAFSPDGTRVLSGSRDDTLRLWGADGTLLRTLQGHMDSVFCVAFSPDGTRIVSGSYDDTVRLWEASGTHVRTFQGHRSTVHCVAFSPDGTRVASGSSDRTIRLWDTNGTHVNKVQGHNNAIDRVALSPDGTHVVSVSNNGTLQLWDCACGALLSILQGHGDSVNCVAFSPNGMHVVSGSRDCTLRLWNAINGACLNTLYGHTNSVECFTFSSDGARVVSGSDDKTLRLWDAVNAVLLNTLQGHQHSVSCVAFSPDDTRIVSGSNDNTVRLWDAASGVQLLIVQGHTNAVSCVTFSLDGMRVASASYDKTIRLWNATSGAHLNTLFACSGSFEGVAFSPDGTRVVSGSSNRSLQLWDATSSAELDKIGGSASNVSILAKHLGPSQTSFTQVVATIGSEEICHSLPSYVLLDGWILSLPERRRMFWIPVSCRSHAIASSERGFVIGTEDGQVIVIDFTAMKSYLRS